jgi:hypothetical protein
LRFRLSDAAGVTAEPLRPAAAANNFERLSADIAGSRLRERQRELREFIRSIEALERRRRLSVAGKALIRLRTFLSGHADGPLEVRKFSPAGKKSCE